jgi:hypothetical protein
LIRQTNPGWVCTTSTEATAFRAAIALEVVPEHDVVTVEP